MMIWQHDLQDGFQYILWITKSRRKNKKKSTKEKKTKNQEKMNLQGMLLYAVILVHVLAVAGAGMAIYMAEDAGVSDDWKTTTYILQGAVGGVALITAVFVLMNLSGGGGGGAKTEPKESPKEAPMEQ
jgi:nitrate reductase gamma subunit